LQQAYELGRVAMGRSLGVFDMVRMHQETMASDVLLARNPAEATRQSGVVGTFLLEVLSPFEAAHRGFRKAWERLQQLNGLLEERNRDLAASNGELAREVTERKRAEEELRQTRDHYISLFEQARAMEENLRQLSAKVFTAQEEERKRISRELHDEIGQALTAINVDMAMLRQRAGADRVFRAKMATAQRLLERSMETIHQFARELRPAMFDHLGPHAAFRAYLKCFDKRTGIATSFRSKVDLNRLDAQQAIVLFRVAQESLTNVFKHARATRAELEFFPAGRELCMEVRDNGRAFRIQDRNGAKWKGRLGLLGMQERVRLINGSFAIDSVSGRGTTIRVKIPLNSRQTGLLDGFSSHPFAHLFARKTQSLQNP